MRRTAFMFVTLLLLLALPVAVAAADRPETAAAPASASIDPASAVGLTDTHATLVAHVVANVTGASATFEYGPTTAYGATAAALPAALPERGATVSALVDGLAPSTTYHFRVVLTGAGVALPGLDATFTTAAPASPQGGDEDGQDDQGQDAADEPVPVQAPAAPVLGRSVAVGPRTGTVRVRKPHGKRFEPLTAGANVAPGSVVDAARLASASRKRGRCLWGRDKGGRFRTHGADSVAAVRGTRWLTEDTCAGTRTKVTEGEVAVRDLNRKRTVTVRAGHSYLARRSR